ncbi:MAG: 50S ribosomal protein L13 [Bacteroidales bacterium]|nr:50S ribosomal protein L13 [Bacteroidales bacterium]
MSTLSYKTQSVKPADVEKKWIVIDAENQIVGRVATRAANILRGKHKPCFTPHVDCGDYVIIINAEKAIFTGKKYTDKVYVRHTGYPGGQRFATPQHLFKNFPVRVMEHAVKGMLPKNKLGARLYTHLHVVVGPEHKFEAQKPEVVELNTLR